MMDPGAIIQEIGGGLAAVVIVSLAVFNVIQYRRNNELQDKLLDVTLTMGRENRDLLGVATTAMQSSTDTIKEAVRRMEGR